ncbi:unnamed protein product [Rotaria socialis]|uniref:Kinesin motor domain-containing protein n=5 Tax=Rotaria socialis TaxID=392032 RepID=A0A820V2S9_9BILA|nr:unnamed protein product [Rotaria socialis]CAF4494532.1 unnamed protein product [Rotaria socialis]
MSTDTTALATPTEPTNGRRAEPPVNVYVRIRPFIGDEITRGENQQMLCIRDEKRIAVKLYPTATNNIRPAQTSYNEYEVTRIFDHNCTQQELFEQILEQSTDEIFTGSNWLLCTLGLTNSGKTHTMFGTPKDPGLIPQCLQRIFLHIGYNIDTKVLYKPDGLENLVQTNMNNLQDEINYRKYIFKDDKDDYRRTRLQSIVQDQPSVLDDHSVEDEHYSIWISFFELYNESVFDLLIKPSAMKKRKPLRLMQNNESTVIKDLVQIPVFDLKEAEDTIRFGYANRATSKTDLNEASSRSHAVLCITLINIDEFEEEPTMSHMYICDLAGNEPSTGTGKQLAETCNINTSLMTFKDCIRVLNENQTAKKQMLLPYRNSVLTSIFRPFFIGRGRTIICCNVNPCATFISQTNDLLKFSALAQKTIIVPVEPAQKKVVLESKIKGPKRLGQGVRGPTIGKKKNHQTVDSEDVEEETAVAVDASGAPVDPNSIHYWKYCTRKALELLQKQASNRRLFFIERHEERTQTVQYVLHQRDQMEQLFNEKQSLNQNIESLSKAHTSEHEHLKQAKENYAELEKKFNELFKKYANANRDNDTLRSRLKNVQQKFDSLNTEYNTTIEQNRQYEQNQFNDKTNYTEEINRLTRDYEQEKHEKAHKDKTIEQLNGKLLSEKNQNEKFLQEVTQLRHDLKSIHSKYDTLQVELLQLRETKNNEPVLVAPPPSISAPPPILATRTLRSKRSAHEEETQDNKKSKLGTPDRPAGNSGLAHKPSTRRVLSKPNTEEERKPTPPIVKDVAKTKSSVSILKKRPLAPSNSADSPMMTPKLTTPATASPIIDLRPPSVVATSIQSTMSPKPTAIQRIQSFFRHTPPSASNRIINHLKTNSAGIACAPSSPTTASPIAILQKSSLAMRKQTPKRRYKLRSRVNSNQ